VSDFNEAQALCKHHAEILPGHSRAFAICQALNQADLRTGYRMPPPGVKP
jgi:hypothetical protein